MTEGTLSGLALFLFLAVGAVSLFTMIAVSNWAEQRRKERETQYRYEMLKKLVDQPGGSSQAMLDMLREEEAAKDRRQRQGLILGGMITAAVGAGMILFLYVLEPEKGVWAVGSIPLFIGLVMLAYILFVAPRTGSGAAPGAPPR